MKKISVMLVMCLIGTSAMANDKFCLRQYSANTNRFMAMAKTNNMVASETQGGAAVMYKNVQSVNKRK